MMGFGQALGEIPEDAPEQQPETVDLQSIPKNPVFKKFVSGSIQILTDPNFMKRAVQLLQQTPMIEDGMARLAVAVATRVYDAADEAGQEIPLEIVLVGGLQVMEAVVEFTQQTGVGEVTEEEAETAFYIAADMFRGHLDGQGKIDHEEMAQTLEQIRVEQGDEPINRVQDRLTATQQAQIAKMAPSMGEQ